MSMSKGSKMLQYINYRMRVTIQDGRQLIGKFMAFDRHMNLVLGDCEEFRKLPPAKKSSGPGAKPHEEREDRRTLGLVLLRHDAAPDLPPPGPFRLRLARVLPSHHAPPAPDAWVPRAAACHDEGTAWSHADAVPWGQARPAASWAVPDAAAVYGEARDASSSGTDDEARDAAPACPEAWDARSATAEAWDATSAWWAGPGVCSAQAWDATSTASAAGAESAATAVIF